MTLLVLAVWALSHAPADIAHPWSTWFTVLFVAAVVDFFNS